MKEKKQASLVREESHREDENLIEKLDHIWDIGNVERREVN
jgi:hypothetical protein